MALVSAQVAQDSDHKGAPETRLPRLFLHCLHASTKGHIFTSVANPGTVSKTVTKYFAEEKNALKHASVAQLGVKIRLLHKAVCADADTRALRKGTAIIINNLKSAPSLEAIVTILQQKAPQARRTKVFGEFMLDYKQRRIISILSIGLRYLPKTMSKIFGGKMVAILGIAADQKQTKDGETVVNERLVVQYLQSNQRQDFMKRVSVLEQTISKQRPDLVEQFSKTDESLELAYTALSREDRKRVSSAIAEYRGYLCVRAGELEKAYQDFLKKFHQRLQAQDYDPLETGVWFAYEYIRLHPFDNGHGRMARLMCNVLLWQAGDDIIIFPEYDEFVILMQRVMHNTEEPEAGLAEMLKGFRLQQQRTKQIMADGDLLACFPKLDDAFFLRYDIWVRAQTLIRDYMQKMRLPVEDYNLATYEVIARMNISRKIMLMVPGTTILLEMDLTKDERQRGIQLGLIKEPTIGTGRAGMFGSSETGRASGEVPHHSQASSPAADAAAGKGVLKK